MDKHVLLGVATLLVTLLYACPTADSGGASDAGGSTPESQTKGHLNGIEQLEDNVFKVYETHSWDYEQKRIKARSPQADFYPTGLYIKPNQSITVTVTSDTAPRSIRMLVGTYSRYEGDEYPDMVSLQMGENTVTNTRNKPRLIYIQFITHRKNLVHNAEIAIDGATKAPYFIRGKTTSQEFQAMLKNYDYDSVLMASNRIMMVASKETALQVQDQDWEETANLLDKVVKRAEYIHGLDSKSSYDVPPTTRILLTEKNNEVYKDTAATISYRISSEVSAVILGAEKAVRTWIDNTRMVARQTSTSLWFHVGTMYDAQQIRISQANVYVYDSAIGRAFDKKRRVLGRNDWDEIKGYLEDPPTKKKFSRLSEVKQFGMLQQLWLGYGSTDEARDKFFINLNKKIRRESENTKLSRDEALAYLMLKSSEVYGYNLNEFFRAWGIQVPQSAFDAVDALKLPKLPADMALTTLDDNVRDNAPQEEQTDKALDGIEELGENVFKVYERHPLMFEYRRTEGRNRQVDFYPTGLYIKPNQTITVTATSDTAPVNIKVFVGTYARYESRDWSPDEFTLQMGKNTITNSRDKPCLIYIQFVDRRPSDVATITIDGATKHPYFIRGKTTNQEFQTMLRDYDYDSVLIASNRIMMVASKEAALQVQNQDWTNTADLLDKAVETAEYIHGLDSETYYDTPPTTRILAVGRESTGDIYVSNHRMSVQKKSVVRWIDSTKIIKEWGMWYGIGQMYQPSQILIDDTTVNIYALAIERAFKQESRLVRDGTWNEIKAYLAKPAAEKKFNDLDVFIKLGMFQQLWLGYGSTDAARDKFFINLNKKIRRESKKMWTSEESLAYLMLKSSEVYGHNLNGFFRKWGFQVPQSAFDAVDELGLKSPPVDPSTLSR